MTRIIHYTKWKGLRSSSKVAKLSKLLVDNVFPDILAHRSDAKISIYLIIYGRKDLEETWLNFINIAIVFFKLIVN